MIKTNYTFMTQFRFYCDKHHCIGSDIVQTVMKFFSVKYSLFQMQHECFKQIEDCSNPFVKRSTRSQFDKVYRNDYQISATHVRQNLFSKVEFYLHMQEINCG